VLTGGWASCL